jgi:hypothetical protein
VRGQCPRRIGERSHFAGNPGETQAIGTVRRELDGDLAIIKLQVVTQIGADGGIFGQHHEAGVIGRDAEFVSGAHHAEGFHATQLGRLDGEFGQLGTHHGARGLHALHHIRGTTDDLQQIALADVDTANLELVGVGVLFKGHNAGHDHAAEFRRDRIDLFNFEAGHGQQFAQRIGIERGITQRA